MVSVNMSARSFSSIDLVGLVSAVLADTGLPPDRLTIELTETTLIAHTERARERINGLRKLGVRVAMDDFGTGYASLGYLSSFNFDVLKLDRTIVRELCKNPRAEAVAKAVLARGKHIKLISIDKESEDAARLRLTPPQKALPAPARKNVVTATRSSGNGPNWDAPKGGDLDEEIPF